MTVVSEMKKNDGQAERSKDERLKQQLHNGPQYVVQKVLLLFEISKSIFCVLSRNVSTSDDKPS